MARVAAGSLCYLSCTNIMATSRLCLILFAAFVCACFFCTNSGKQESRKTSKTPAAGWCLNRHNPKKAAQSGYDGYCKICFQETKRCDKKQLRRKKHCVFCKKAGEMYRWGFCKPCLRARSCDVCSAVNTNTVAAICSHWEKSRAKLGAAQSRLALWCQQCTCEDDRMSQLCGQCLRLHREGYCTHCGACNVELPYQFKSAEDNCRAVLSLCAQCVALTRGQEKMQCGSCWSSNGEMCIFCRSRKAQHDLDKYRACRPRIQKKFCQQCMSSPDPAIVVPKCQMCSSCAMWCEQHCSADQLQSGLCAKHYSAHAQRCQDCTRGDDPASDCALVWHLCGTADCLYRLRVCNHCAKALQATRFICDVCWSRGDHKRIACETTRAQKEKQFLRCCVSCYGKLRPDERARLVREVKLHGHRRRNIFYVVVYLVMGSCAQMRDRALSGRRATRIWRALRNSRNGKVTSQRYSCY